MLRKGIQPSELAKWAEGFQQYSENPDEESLFECDKKKNTKPARKQMEDDDM